MTRARVAAWLAPFIIIGALWIGSAIGFYLTGVKG